MKMHDGHDHNHIRLDSEEDTEGKRLSEATAHITIDHCIERRVEFNSVERVLNTGEKALAEVRLLRLVPRSCVDHLGFGFRMKTDRFHPKDA